MTAPEHLLESVPWRASTRDDKKYMVKVDGKTVHFGDPDLRHNCAGKSDRKTAGYWACRLWGCRAGGSN